MKTKLILLSTLLIVSCGKESEKTELLGKNKDIKVELLFTKDSIKVYRFNDNGYYHYFTNRNETINNQTQNLGKSNYTYNENIK